MAYTALYRKFRPINFNEMVGQEHITKTLKNQIIANRVGHAYLFSGGRGTGKTSAAKIMARAINCLHPKEDGEPCNECEICKGILDGSLTDVVEMDAASNNSVEDVRVIRDEVNFLPTLAKYRVYIIDEVHMLSVAAFNALLKTLEEPPEHVKFILATTEPQKLPATILSRCQRFDFKRITVDDIVKRLDIICKESNIEITKDALKMIGILAEGALRDGISILERCSQNTDGVIDENQIRELVGMPKLETIKTLAVSLIEENPEKAIELTDNVIEEGKDLDNLLWEMIKYIRDVLIYKATNTLELYSKEDLKFIEEISKKTNKTRLLDLIYELSELANNMKTSSQKNIIFQAGIIKTCMSTTYKLEKKEMHSQVVNVPKEKNINIQEEKEIKKIIKPVENKTNQTNRTNTTSQNVVPYWQNVLDNIKQSGKMTIYVNLIGTKGILLNDLMVGIQFPGKITDFARKLIEENENKSLIEKFISMEQGTPMKVKILDNAESIKVTNEQDNIESLAKNLDLPFNIIDG